MGIAIRQKLALDEAIDGPAKMLSRDAVSMFVAIEGKNGDMVGVDKFSFGRKRRCCAAASGVAIEDVRIRRADLPQENTQAILNRMKSERERVAAQARDYNPADHFDAKRLDLLVDDAELASRRTGWKPNAPRYTSGVLGKYARLVQGAETAAITNTL